MNTFASDVIEKRVASSTARAEKLTQAILANAFRGELVPTEAELARRRPRLRAGIGGAAAYSSRTGEELLQCFEAKEFLNASHLLIRRLRLSWRMDRGHVCGQMRPKLVAFQLQSSAQAGLRAWLEIDDFQLDSPESLPFVDSRRED